MSPQQVPFAEQLRAGLKPDARIPISSVGLITSGKQAEEILQSGKADLVRSSFDVTIPPIAHFWQISVAREFLRNADLVFDWAMELDTVVNVPVQYQRAHTRMM